MGSTRRVLLAGRKPRISRPSLPGAVLAASLARSGSVAYHFRYRVAVLMGRCVSDGTPVQHTLHDVQQALAGDDEALNRLVLGLSPVIQDRVVRALLRGSPGRSNLRTVVEDLTQEILLGLFKDQGRALGDWDPERGLSLEAFVGMVADRRVISVLRRMRRNPWTEKPTEAHMLDRRQTAADPATEVVARDHLGRTLRRMRAELSPLGWHVFQLLFVREYSVVEAGRATNLSADAIYAWRSRLRRLARRLRDEERS